MSFPGPDMEIALNVAANDALSRRHEFITLEHFLYALLLNDETAKTINRCGADTAKIKDDLNKFLFESIPPLPPEVHETTPKATLAVQRVINRAIQHLQSSEKNSELTGGDIIVALLDEKESNAAYILKKAGVDRFELVSQISQQMSETEGAEGADSEGKPSGDFLQTYAVNLVEKAERGEIDPIIGRQAELTRIAHTLCRRRKNNPLFVGDPGVGKTALAEGLALQIHEGNVPEVLKKATIYSLDMGALLAGTKFRGDFEKRLKGVVKAIKKIDGAILFIDEIHTVVGGGSTTNGSMDASTLLKPSLASGELRCIGSTTYGDYRNSFEKDHALARRFQKIEIREPSIEDTVQMLKGLKSRYEEFHGVTYSLAALKAAVELSDRYINDRKLPDKAIDVIDEVGASIQVLPLKKQRKSIGVREIENIIATMAQIPSKRVSADDRQSLKALEGDLKLQVFGQDEAISSLVSSIKLSRAGLSALEKPVGSFLFTGPTGVGKTEVAKQLARIMGVQFVRFDMSEYSEQHTVSRLIGAPPGYVGFDQGGLLTEAISQTPHCVLLLDEIEKAHQNLFDILLQVMDHATLIDNNGKKTSFRNVILIMTSNAGARDLQKGSIGFGDSEQTRKGASDKQLKQIFSPEFRNRLDDIITFHQLELDVIGNIVDKLMAELEAQLSDKKVVISLTPKARRWLAKEGYDPVYGARPLARLIDKHIKRPLAEEILFGKLEKGGTVAIDLKKNELTFVY